MTHVEKRGDDFFPQDVKAIGLDSDPERIMGNKAIKNVQPSSTRFIKAHAETVNPFQLSVPVYIARMNGSELVVAWNTLPQKLALFPKLAKSNLQRKTHRLKDQRPLGQ